MEYYSAFLKKKFYICDNMNEPITERTTAGSYLYEVSKIVKA